MSAGCWVRREGDAPHARAVSEHTGRGGSGVRPSEEFIEGVQSKAGAAGSSGGGRGLGVQMEVKKELATRPTRGREAGGSTVRINLIGLRC